jgi:hypothetical protein
METFNLKKLNEVEGKQQLYKDLSEPFYIVLSHGTIVLLGQIVC